MVASNGSIQPVAATQAALSSINLDETLPFHQRDVVTSATDVTILQSGGSGFVGVSAIADPSVTGVAEVSIFDGTVSLANKIGGGKVVADGSVCVAGSPMFYRNGITIQAHSDGTNELEVFSHIISVNPTEQTIIPESQTAMIRSQAATTPQSTANFTVVSNVTGNNRRGLFQFDFSSVPIGAQCNNATLRFYDVATHAEFTSDITMYAVLIDWIAGQTTWNDRVTSTAWDTAGLGSGTDREATAFFTGSWSNTAGDPHDFDVTDLVNEWLITPASNFGILLQFASAGGANNVSLYNASNADPDTHPSIILTF